MAANTFLQLLSAEMFAHREKIGEWPIVILPSKRAKIFLLRELRANCQTPVFAPEIWSVEEFISKVSGANPIEELNLLLEFYNVYKSVTSHENIQDFSFFANWAPTALADFNEIDRYLLNPDAIFDYLKAIDDIKKWGANPDDTPLLKRYLNFWNQLPKYYYALKERLLQLNLAYQGLAYRLATEQIQAFAANTNEHFFFAGFNALNAAEERIIKSLMELGKAQIFFDIDKTLFADKTHDAGLFLRRYATTWPQFRSQNMNFITDAFSQHKEINCLGTTGRIGQVKIAAQILNEWVQQNPEHLSKIAVVLADESLLQPLLAALPSHIETLNITMGLPLEKSSVVQLFKDILRMQLAAKQRKGGSIYHRDLLRVLSHNFISGRQANKILQYLTENNIAFCNSNRLLQRTEDPLLRAILTDIEPNGSNLPAYLTTIINLLKPTLSVEQRESRLQLSYLFEFARVVAKWSEYLETAQQQITLDIDQAIQILKQLLKTVTVSFEGEPLEGLQIMGILESRTLDFERVLVLGLNEGKLPAGKSFNSFIPHDVKRERGLPTYREKDAIFSYHFYHLLQRAKHVDLIYNLDTEGFESAERSRFITQLLFDPSPNHQITERIFNTFVEAKAEAPQEIIKTPTLINQIKQLLAHGLSPSAVDSYLRSPLEFYKQYLLGLRPEDEVEENIAANTLGTIIHNVFEKLYEPYLNQVLTTNFYDKALALFPELLQKEAEILFKEGDLAFGQNFLEISFARTTIKSYLEAERALVATGNTLIIRLLEQKLSADLSVPEFDFPVRVSGKVDRIDELNGTIRVLDYKTGRVDRNYLKFDAAAQHEANLKESKVLQLLTYAFAAASGTPFKTFEAGIISLRSPKEGAIVLQLKNFAASDTVIDQAVFDQYQQAMTYVISEMLNPDVPFTADRKKEKK
ncbi:PD-(D/E)XK nuclease family protein [Flavobacterium aurantiibacter]|uniref:PD-(D/E)XK endonuclease-like domain-containing protein n=1 Tax=Flavobacterium aurantiibacter TaxID=2023067 RepID=A0A255ZT47_9FLAO|nr:PD-(D/E)XK nuclease family protein [Flavobacterium aurantiibacter]OYQ43900.1 hypothetical protein CHX27_08470 [Flavobacterium aurantiibacter]